jgi:hypothetical protein
VVDGVRNGLGDLALLGLLLTVLGFFLAAWQAQRRIDEDEAAVEALRACETELELVRVAVDRIDRALSQAESEPSPNSPPPAAAR